MLYSAKRKKFNINQKKKKEKKNDQHVLKKINAKQVCCKSTTLP